MILEIRNLVQKGVYEKVYPGAVILVSVSGRLIECFSAGYSQMVPHPVSMKQDTIFDLASLTKPLATTLALMKLVDKGLIDLDAFVSDVFAVPRDKERITLRMLLTHSSGLPAWRPYYLMLRDYPLVIRKGVIREWILKEELVFPPGKSNLYSDLGFIILEGIIDEVSGAKMKDLLFSLYASLNLTNTFLGYPEHKLKRDQFAATEFCPWRKRIIQGEVHDENAFSLGGYSGHAGLFSTVRDIFAIINMLLNHYYGRAEDVFRKETVKAFFEKQNERWTLGWDTPTGDNSSSGKLFSENSVGHLGYTGTSIWIDLKKEIVVIFLTNRTYPTRKNEKIKQFRPFIHDMIMKQIL